MSLHTRICTCTRSKLGFIDYTYFNPARPYRTPSLSIDPFTTSATLSGIRAPLMNVRRGSLAATRFDNNKKMLECYGRYEESWWLERLGSQDAPNTDMFDLCEGSVLTILSDCGDGLLLVRTDSGKTGYVQNAVCFW